MVCHFLNFKYGKKLVEREWIGTNVSFSLENDNEEETDTQLWFWMMSKCIFLSNQYEKILVDCLNYYFNL